MKALKEGVREATRRPPHDDGRLTQVRSKLTVDKLVNKEITSHITITDADVKNFYNANKRVSNGDRRSIWPDHGGAIPRPQRAEFEE
jgi:hypothetical protein